MDSHRLAAEGDTYIVSDLHLGSEYFRLENFVCFLDTLPGGVSLVLNGDTIDEPGNSLSAEHEAVVQRLVAESKQRPVVWIHGNHDESFGLDDPGGIQFARRWEVDRVLLVLHGDQLDGVMPRHGLFKILFKKFHRLRIRLGFPDVHVADYAKRFGLLYRVLSKHVARRALDAAQREGFGAVTCGHTHAPMELERGGLRYLNTGAWTEVSNHYVAVTEGGRRVELRVFANGST
jgi:UDP-2,3-diacylglucosamine pyrophosphatase LpxH